MNDLTPFESCGRSHARELLVIWVLLSAGTACQDPPVREVAPPGEEPELIARVNGVPVYRSDFKEYLALSDEHADEEPVEPLFREFLVQLILFQDAEREGYARPTEQAREQTVDWGVVREADPVAVQKWNHRFLSVQAYITSSLDAGSRISLRELRAYYVEHEQEFVVKERLRVLEILVKNRALAEKLRARLAPGDFRTFRELAVQHSVGTHIDGELGVFEAGQLPSVFEKVIFDLEIGEISPVFSSQSGYHLFTVEERTPQHFQKFFEVQEEIFELLVEQREREAVEAFVQDRVSRANVEILDEELASVWSRGHAEHGEFSLG